MKYTYAPKGVCSQKFIADIDNGIIKNFEVIGGCQGNLRGICSLIKGQSIDWVIERLENIDCHGRGTSCPDQISKFLKSIKK